MLLKYEEQINALDESKAFLSNKQQPITVDEAIKEIEILESCIKKVEEIIKKYDNTKFYFDLSNLLNELNKRKKRILNAKLSKIDNY